VLRIGLVQRGRIVEERVIKQRTTVTVGSSEKNMFVVPVPANMLPAQFKLFELLNNDYYLNFTDGMQGRVALATGITDIAALRGQAKRVNNISQVKLSEEARGKVVIGDCTFLFQFVTPPPIQPRPQLPLAVKGLTNQIDWALTIIAAFSFLLHFGFVGAMYSDWFDSIVSDGIDVGLLVDRNPNVPNVQVNEPTDATATAAATSTAAPTATAGSTKSAGGAAGPKGAVSEAKAAALAAQADAMQMAMLASLAGGSSVQGALNRSDIPPVDLSGAAASGAGVSPGSGDLRFGSGGSPVQGRGSGLAGLGGGTGGGGTGGAGVERRVEGPRGDAQVGGSTATVPISDADRVIAGLRGRFRQCYQQGLNSDPTMQGRVLIVARVQPNGEVASADVGSNTGLSAGVAACIARHVKNAQFSPPGGGGSTINIPVTFVQQNK
jgi:hypothetical protein